MHKTTGLRNPAAAFPLPKLRDDARERREANRAVGVSAIGLAATGLVELLRPPHRLGGPARTRSTTCPTSPPAPWCSSGSGCPGGRRPTDTPTAWNEPRTWPGSVLPWSSGPARSSPDTRASTSSSSTATPATWAAGIAGAALGIVGNQVVARYKLVVGKRIGSATLIADARHSWLDALSSAGALAGLVAVALGQPWGDPVAGLAVTAFICHVGDEVTGDVVHRLADGVDPGGIPAAEAAAGSVPGVIHAHARARWTGRTLRVEVEGWVDPNLTVRAADDTRAAVAEAISAQLPEAGSLTWTTRAAT